MGKLFFIAIALAVAWTYSAAAFELRSVDGSVTDKHGNSLPGAVVYIENTATKSIRSFIVQRDGKYHFDQLNPDVDFILTAKYRKYESKPRRLSEFNSSVRATVDLVIPAE